MLQFDLNMIMYWQIGITLFSYRRIPAKIAFNGMAGAKASTML